jgi:amino acid permease
MANFESVAESGGSELRRALRVRHLAMLTVRGTIAPGFLSARTTSPRRLTGGAERRCRQK